ncbi:MAG: hypothetical protein FJ254_06295 [Phycisphaerae bacterium]|nr:hypothetical protein [Phycisphaerae bacterium]
MDPDGRSIAWAGLVGRWSEWAAASRVWPEHGDAGRARASVPWLIQLQAVTHALGELSSVPPGERPWCRDHARATIDAAVERLVGVWGDEAPNEIADIVDDARAAIDQSRHAGCREAVWSGPGRFIVPEIELDAPRGTLACMQPGTPVLPDSPVAWWIDREDLVVPGLAVRDAAHGPSQVYRQLDDSGRVVQDLIATMDELSPGMPLLIPIDEDGRRIGGWLTQAPAWRAMHEQALGDLQQPAVRWHQ